MNDGTNKVTGRNILSGLGLGLLAGAAACGIMAGGSYLLDHSKGIHKVGPGQLVEPAPKAVTVGKAKDNLIFMCTDKVKADKPYIIENVERYTFDPAKERWVVWACGMQYVLFQYGSEVCSVETGSNV